MFTRDKGQESCLLGMRNARNRNANKPFQWLQGNVPGQGTQRVRTPGKPCLQVLDVLLITISGVLATCDQKCHRSGSRQEGLRRPAFHPAFHHAGRKCRLQLPCLPLTAQGIRSGSVRLPSSPLLLFCTR